MEARREEREACQHTEQLQREAAREEREAEREARREERDERNQQQFFALPSAIRAPPLLQPPAPWDRPLSAPLLHLISPRLTTFAFSCSK